MPSHYKLTIGPASKLSFFHWLMYVLLVAHPYLWQGGEGSMVLVNEQYPLLVTHVYCTHMG
jgi:hypothetical protein